MQNHERKSRWTVVAMAFAIVFVAAAVVFGQVALEAVFSDAATRLAYQIRDEAAALRRSGQATRTFEHHPRAWPHGVDADYRIEITVGWKPPGPGHRSIGVARNLTERTFYATSYHMNFVDVPDDLFVSHRKGEPTLVTLTIENGRVLLTALR